MASTLAQQRLTTLRIKKQLHDKLGENGLPYWSALGQFLTGQMGKDEFDWRINGLLDYAGVVLHNDLLMSLMASTTHSTPSAPLSSSFSTNAVSVSNSAKRPSSAEPEELAPQAKRRVSKWVLEMGSKERMRIRSLSAKAAERELQINQELATADVEDEDEDADADGEDEDGNPIMPVPKVKVPLERKIRLVYNSGELGRERAMLSMDSSLQLGAEAGLPSGSSTPLPNPLSALITKKLPSHAELAALVLKGATEHGLTGGLGASKGGVNAGVTGNEEIGKVLGQAVDEFVSNLTLKHLSNNRSNLSNAPSISLPSTPTSLTPPAMEDIPALSSSASSSSSASLKSLDPEEGLPSKKNRVWSMNEFQATAEMHPTVIGLRGSAIRRLSSGLYYDQINPDNEEDETLMVEDEDELFEADYSVVDESILAKSKFAGLDELPMIPLHPAIKNSLNHHFQQSGSDQQDEEMTAIDNKVGVNIGEAIAGGASNGVKERKKKGRKDDYDYVDPKSILDVLLG